jgi:hypothetical protein
LVPADQAVSDLSTGLFKKQIMNEVQKKESSDTRPPEKTLGEKLQR